MSDQKIPLYYGDWDLRFWASEDFSILSERMESDKIKHWKLGEDVKYVQYEHDAGWGVFLNNVLCFNAMTEEEALTHCPNAYLDESRWWRNTPEDFRYDYTMERPTELTDPPRKNDVPAKEDRLIAEGGNSDRQNIN